MPELSTLLLFAVAAVALIAIPGPNLIYIATRSMSEGRRAGLASVLGVETGTLIHSLAAALGISALVASSATAFEVVRYAGAAYLVYLGVRELLRRRDPSDPAAPRPEPSLARAYRQGVLVQVLNPKVALFFLAFLPQFVDPARGSVATQVLVLGTLLAVLGAGLSSAWALGAGALGERLRDRPSLAERGGYLTGAVYIALGAAAALTGGRRER
jgi:threonine/homoserine/homoserine lactone efflux protein